ncbi:MAG: alpha/beta hydrolase [Candidatus Hodarchaeales archaeon]|jgi:alpha-beta hydrolase superfamily lysophospholipase
MEHTEESFTAHDGTELYFQKWKPETKPKAIVQIVHGLAEYSTRYMNVVEALIPAEIAVYSKDHRGHGKSGGIRGHVNRFEDYLVDENDFTQLIKKKEPGIPLFLLGHSMGSIISIYFASEHQSDFEGLILSGTGSPATSKVNPIMIFLARILSKIWPTGKIGLDLAEDISRDPAVVDAYINDPLVFNKVSFRFGAELLNVSKKLPEIVSTIKIPILGQAGGEDQLMLDPAQLFSSVTSEDSELKIYDGLFHEVYNELESDRKLVLNDLKDWLEKHI